MNKLRATLLSLLFALSLCSLARAQTYVYPDPANTFWPAVSFPATGLTLTYTAGNVYSGTSATAITGSTLTLTNTKNTCTITAIQAATDACNYVYWTTGASLSTSTVFTTATAANNTLLYLCNTTGGNITACLPASVLRGLTPNGALSAVTGSGSVVLATAPAYTAGTTAVAATLSPTCAANSGQVIFVGATTGEVVTLPTPAAGCWFDFIITVSNTSNSNEIQTAASQFLVGHVSEAASAGAVSAFWADGTTTRAIKCNGTTTGGLIGSFFHVVGTSTTVWEITGMNEASGVIATPFTATP